MNEGVRNLIVGSLVLVLASMYGGDMLGSWFVMKVEMESGGDSYTGIDKFYLTETKSDLAYDYQDSSISDEEPFQTPEQE